MMGLVDYGSASDSENEDNSSGNDSSQPHLVKKPVKKIETSQDLDDGFFSNQGAADSNSQESILHLPTVSHIGRMNANVVEGELEDMVKQRDWEVELAEKTKKKLLKKAKKDKKKEKKEPVEGEKEMKLKSKAKAQITAFGALSTLGKDSDSDEEVKDKSAPDTFVANTGSGLLGMLPPPKKAGQKTVQGLGGAAKSGTGILLPPSLRNKTAPKPSPVVEVTASKRKAESDDSDDGDDVSDFFGLSSAPEPKITRVGSAAESVPILASYGFDVAAGPSKPIDTDYVHPSQMYNYANAEEDMPGPSLVGFRGVTDEQAYKMLSRDEGVQIERRNIHNIATNLVEYSVDAALGPNVQANILKNMHKKTQIREVSQPLPKSKNPTDKVSRQKHQITYLANLAVAREEALQEQWSNNKQQKQMSRQKYGF